MRKTKFWALVLAIGLLVVIPWANASGESAPRLDKDTLRSWLSDPQVIILDVRQPRDWESSAMKIKGALRQDPKEVKTWAAALPKDKKIVLYCA